MSVNGKIRWGIIGCGKIAHKFASDLLLTPGGELFAVASRDLNKADDFGKKYHAKKHYGNYEDLFADADVDIVYIATPHASHAVLSIQAMENGKHVLCEKPLAINLREAKAMIACSKRTNRFFMEALWTRFNPVILDVKNKIDSGAIGRVNYINADFAFKSEFGVHSRVLDLSLGGGALLDIGIYPVFLSYLILGKPHSIKAISHFHEITGCDMQTSMILDYEDAQAVLYCGFTSTSDMIGRISADKGQIYLHKTWHHTEGYTLVKDGNSEKVELPITGYGYTYEIAECHKCLSENKIQSDLWSHHNSLDLISILDEIRKITGLKYPGE
ncbi:MAG: Gfo/Idh/MocA family oxidoreductase [Flavobacteriaceae bacterium]|nr:Gfo/Idh/MocA family oxidoreductase [Flavobacteriaceae bacterium]